MKTLELLNPSMQVFESLESEVRSYCRGFPTIFTKSRGYKIWDVNGKEYIDFFAGAGALNYGHNNPSMKERLIEYLQEDGISHSLDMATQAKERFLQAFHDVILKPRGFRYKVMFPGPTGTNSVESALKLARKVTGRELIMSFTNGFHGMTIGSLAITGNKFKRKGAGVSLQNSIAMPYDGFFGDNIDTIDYIERLIEGNGSGVSLPAAMIMETVQGEGGVNPASFEWMKKIEKLCRKHGILLIVDDIQVGCGRTGPFFSFEKANIEPDIICLSKSIGGCGQPFAITLMKPELDIWEPGEHNGTFRGNNLAFVAATEALKYWQTDRFQKDIEEKGKLINCKLQQIADKHPELKGEVRGRGMIQGIEYKIEGFSDKVCAACFERGLIIETSGPNSEVVKLLPPLIIDEIGLLKGLKILEESVEICKQQLA